MIQKPTCYKNPSQPTCIDLILTNRPSYFQHSEVFETNLSDFHLLTVTELKMNFQKQKPKIIAYRDYKKFDNNAFRHDIQKCTFNTADLKTFKETVFCIFNKHAPMKRKYVRANEAPFMTKELHKAIMKRSRLRNKFLKNKNEINRNNYKVQRNYCKKLLKTTKKQYFNNLNTSKVTDNRILWKTVVLLLTNKPSGGEEIILKEGNKNITNDAELCEVFNTYFANIAAKLNIPNANNYIRSKENSNKYPQKMKSFRTHPSIITRTNQYLISVFNFQKPNANDVMKIISQLNETKTCQKTDTPTKIIKLNKDIFAKFISNNFNHYID